MGRPLLRLSHVMEEGPWGRTLAAVFVLAVALRLLFAFAVMPRIHQIGGIEHTDGYEAIGRSVVGGGGFSFGPGSPPTAARVPLYPLFLAGVFSLFGDGIRPVQIFQAFFDGATALFLMGLGRRLFSRSTGGMAGLFFAVYPLSVLYSARFYSESLYTLLLVVTVGVFLKAREGGSAAVAAASGVGLGLLALTRAVSLYLPVVLVPFLLFGVPWQRSAGRRVAGAAVLLLAMSAVLAPWVARNMSLTGRFSPGGFTAGEPAYHGQYVSTHLSVGRDVSALHDSASKHRESLLEREALRAGRPLTEYEADQVTRRAVLDNMAESPGTTALFFARNLFLVWFLTRTWAMMAVAGAFHLFLLWGAARFRVHHRVIEPDRTLSSIGPLVAVLAYFVAVHALVFPFVRYIAPAVPFLMVVAAAGVCGPQFSPCTAGRDRLTASHYK